MHRIKLEIVEILNLIKNCKDNQDKVRILKEHDSRSLRQVIYANFSNKVKFLLPDTPATYKKSKWEVGVSDASLIREARRLYLFVEGGHPTLSQLKRELLWVQLLEGLAPEEAELLENLKTKSLGKIFNLSKPIAVRAFPELFVGEEEAVESVVPVVKKEEALCLDSVVTDTPVKKKRGRPPKVKTV